MISGRTIQTNVFYETEFGKQPITMQLITPFVLKEGQ